MKFKLKPLHIYIASIQLWLIIFGFRDIRFAGMLFSFPLTLNFQSIFHLVYPLQEDFGVYPTLLDFFHLFVKKRYISKDVSFSVLYPKRVCNFGLWRNQGFIFVLQDSFSTVGLRFL